MAASSKLRQNVAHGGDALVKCFQDFVVACRLGKIESFGRLGGIVADKANDSARYRGEMEGKLSGGHGFFVGLPGEFVFGQALEKLARDGRLGFKFGKEFLCDRHDGSPQIEMF